MGIAGMERAITELGAIHGVDCGLRVVWRLEADVPEALGRSSAIPHDASLSDLPKLGELLQKALVCDVVVKILDEEGGGFGEVGWLPHVLPDKFSDITAEGFFKANPSNQTPVIIVIV